MNKLEITCKYGCKVTLSEAHLHMETCKFKNCWNCDNAALPHLIKISQTKDCLITTNDKFKTSKKENSQGNLNDISSLIKLEKEVEALKTTVNELNKQIKAKTHIHNLIQKLKEKFNKGQSIKELNSTLIEKKEEF